MRCNHLSKSHSDLRYSVHPSVRLSVTIFPQLNHSSVRHLYVTCNVCIAVVFVRSSVCLSH